MTQTILFAKKPEEKAIEIPIENFSRMISQKRGVTFTWLDSSILEKDGSRTPCPDSIDLHHFVVCPMKSEDGSADTGLGVFAKRFIPRETVLFSYTGQRFSLNNRPPDYEIGLSAYRAKTSMRADPYMINEPEAIGKDKKATSALLAGNLASLIQHAESPSIDTYTHRNVGYANIYFRKSKLGGALVLVTKDDIKPGEGLFFNYSADYWSKLDKIPCLFRRTGEIVDGGFIHINTLIILAAFMARELGKHLPEMLDYSSRLINLLDKEDKNLAMEEPDPMYIVKTLAQVPAEFFTDLPQEALALFTEYLRRFYLLGNLRLDIIEKTRAVAKANNVEELILYFKIESQIPNTKNFSTIRVQLAEALSRCPKSEYPPATSLFHRAASKAQVEERMLSYQENYQKGLSYYKEENYPQAEAHFTQSLIALLTVLAMKEKVSSDLIDVEHRFYPKSEAAKSLYWNLGNVYLKQGEYLKASRFLAVAVAIATKRGSSETNKYTERLKEANKNLYPEFFENEETVMEAERENETRIRHCL